MVVETNCTKIKMKIKTITCHRVYNHGAALQAWALATYLRQQGHEVYIINYRPDYLRGHFKLHVGNPKYNKPILRQLYLLAKYLGWKRSLARKAAFDAFDAKYIEPVVTREYLTIDELQMAPPMADAYIAGSDQIWNTTFRNGTDPGFYLDFGTKEAKRISYAASFASSSLREGTEEFVKHGLSNFDHISVREPSGITLLHSMGYKGTLVCDPVFLIDREQWSKDIATNDGEGEKYVLVYDFEGGKEMKSIVQRIAKMKGLMVYSVGFKHLRYADKNFVNSAPDTFVALVKYATCVVSNSFHATAFSFIFNKDFFVVKRSDGLNTRMHDLLTRYGVVERLVDNNVSDLVLNGSVDYLKVNSRMQREISESKRWLEENLVMVSK